MKPDKRIDKYIKQSDLNDLIKHSYKKCFYKYHSENHIFLERETNMSKNYGNIQDSLEHSYQKYSEGLWWSKLLFSLSYTISFGTLLISFNYTIFYVSARLSEKKLAELDIKEGKEDLKTVSTSKQDIVDTKLITRLKKFITIFMLLSLACYLFGSLVQP